MKDLIKHLNESLRIGINDSPEELIKPKDWYDLRKIIEKRFEEQGPGTRQNPIDFNDIDVSEMTTFFNEYHYDGIFEKTNFEYIDISQWDAFNIKDITHMFFECKKLKYVNMCDTPNARYMRYMFDECIELEDIPMFDISNMIDMEGAFRSCRNILTIPKFDTLNVKIMRYLCCYCSSLKSVPQFNIPNVQSIDYMFEYCTVLKDVPIFKSMNKVSAKEMFRNCGNLNTKTKKIWNPDENGTPHI